MNRRIVNIQTGEVTDVALTVEEIAAEESKTAAYLAENPEYINQRQAAYPSIADQLDQIYHEGIDAWKTTIAAVKAEYPKP